MQKLDHKVVLELSAVALLIIYFCLIIGRFGVSWDNIVGHYNTLTMAGKSSYYEILREPLAQLILLPGVIANLSLNEDILLAQAFLALFLLFCTKKLAESLKVKGISAYLIALSLVVMTYTFTLNLTDVFGLSSAILAFAYYFEEDYTKSSIVFGLAFLAKFTNLIFLPCMPFMFNGKWRIKSLAIVFLVNLPWFIANYYIYNNPIYGFELSNQVFSTQHIFTYSTIFVALKSFVYVLETVIVLAIITAFFAKTKKYKINGLISQVDRTDLIVLGFALFEFVYVGSAQNYVPWLLYPLFVALFIIALKVFSKVKLTGNEAFAVNVLYFLIFLSSIIPLMYYTVAPYSSADWQLWFSKNPSYTGSLNISASNSCGLIYSNAWPYQMLYNPRVMPLYQINSTILPGSCLILFNATNIGVPISLVNLRYTTLEGNRNYSIIKYNGTVT